MGPQFTQRTMESSRSVSNTNAPITSATNPTAGHTIRFMLRLGVSTDHSPSCRGGLVSAASLLGYWLLAGFVADARAALAEPAGEAPRAAVMQQFQHELLPLEQELRRQRLQLRALEKELEQLKGDESNPLLKK